MTLPRQDIGWTPDTLFRWTESKFSDAEKFQAAVLAAQKERLDKMEQTMAQRFDGVDENFKGLRTDIEAISTSISTLGSTVSQRSGALSLIRQIVPNAIAIGSIIALVLVANGH